MHIYTHVRTHAHARILNVKTWIKTGASEVAAVKCYGRGRHSGNGGRSAWVGGARPRDVAVCRRSEGLRAATGRRRSVVLRSARGQQTRVTPIFTVAVCRHRAVSSSQSQSSRSRTRLFGRAHATARRDQTRWVCSRRLRPSYPNPTLSPSTTIARRLPTVRPFTPFSTFQPFDATWVGQWRDNRDWRQCITSRSPFAYGFIA